MVKMKNLLNGNTWLWERGKFMNRRYMIQEMYQQFLDGEDVLKRPKEEDPFWEPTEDVLIGTASVFPQSLSYALDFDDCLTITNYKGEEEGKLFVSITPCNHQGRSLDEDSFVDDPKELLGKPYHFKIYVKSAEIHKSRFCKGVLVKYKVSAMQDTEFTETKLITGTLTPEFNHSHIVSIANIGQEHLDFFDVGCITFCVYGKQEDTEGDPKLVKLTTKELRRIEQITAVENGRRNTILAQEQLMGGDQSHAKTELVLMHRKYERLVQKERRMMQLCEEWSKKPPEEQQFAPFFRAVSAVAHSTGTRLKARVQLLSQEEVPNGKDEVDTVSLFVFGEEESTLAAEAESNNGIIPRERVDNHHFPIDSLVLEKMHAKAQVQNSDRAAVKEGSGKTKEGSSTCTLM